MMKSLIFSLILVSFHIFAISESEISGHFFYVKGQVKTTTASNRIFNAAKNDRIYEGDYIEVDERSLAILSFPDGSKVKLSPGSSMHVESIVQHVDGSSLGETSLLLKLGRAVVNVLNEKKEPNFKLKAREVVFGVRGTKFFVGHDEDNHLWASTSEGELELFHKTDRSMSEAIDAGHGIVVENGSKFTHPQRYDWVKDLKYQAHKSEHSDGGFGKIASKRKVEFKKKRKRWKRNHKKWKERKQKWKENKNKYELKHKRKADILKKIRSAKRSHKSKRQRNLQKRKQERSIRKKIKRNDIKSRKQNRKSRGENRRKRRRRP